jgi:hypothetical protein
MEWQASTKLSGVFKICLRIPQDRRSHSMKLYSVGLGRSNASQ